MDFLRSTSDLLVDHLRGSITRGELSNPLPSARDWSHKLGVSRMTLSAALKTLAREGLIILHSRLGAEVSNDGRRRASMLKKPRRYPRLVRVLYHGPDYPNFLSELDWFPDLSERLQAHEAHLTLERCTEARLRAISVRGEHPQEMLLLQSLSPLHQKFFAPWKHSALILGRPAPGVSLPYIGTDVTATVRHATLTLLRHGFSKISLLLERGRSPGLAESSGVFQSTCAGWKGVGAHSEVVSVPLELEPMLLATRRFASQVTQPQGIIVNRAVSLCAVLAALLARGISIPGKVEVVAIESSREAVRTSPSVCHYPFPVQEFVKTLTQAAVHFFQKRALPKLRRTMISELVPAARRG